MAGLSEKIYLSSPVWGQQILVAAYGWAWYRRRFNTHFHHLVKEFKDREQWSEERFAGYQREQLYGLLTLSQHAPYWGQVLKGLSISLDLSIPELLAQLPLLTKETLRTHATSLLTQNPPRGTLIQKSSGTTGTPTLIYYTPEFHALELAVAEARNLNWAGVNFRDRRVMFGVRKVCHFEQNAPPFWRFSPVEDMAYASIYHLSPAYLPHYIAFLRDFRPAVIMGYPSALYRIATHALETGDLPGPARVVVTTSETVSETVRQALETAWRCKVFDRYGAVEACMFASQCEEGRYHVSPEIGVIEIIDEAGRPCPPGVIGEVICTGLQNSLQPLIRYRVGDVACWSVDQSCSCGREMPILERIEGRFEDVCFTLDGRQMVRFDTVFKGVGNIKEAQVVQEKLDFFTIKVVPTPAFDQADIQQIEHNMQLHVGQVSTHVQPVPQIERSPSGKFRAVICKLTAEEKAHLRAAR